MRKLLLVMLVPVLVLGVMGCGTKVQDGDASPIALQGFWESNSSGTDAVNLVIAGNQTTIVSKFNANLGNIALRTNYSGYKGVDENGLFNDPSAASAEFKLEFFWFDTPYDKIGEITCNNLTPTSFTVKEVKYNTYYQNVMLPAAGVSYAAKP